MYKIEEIRNKIIQGNTLEVLKKIPDESVDCIITSPPYWGLRDYGEETIVEWEDGEYQLGLEPTLDLYIKHLLQITAELKRVLKKTGVMFWNHGDSYGGSLQGYGAKEPSKTGFQKPVGIDPRYSKEKTPLARAKAKCMMMQNYRLILKMIDEQGWILRNTIIWHKPNHMPSSVKDRFANAYEPVFFLTKNNKPIYYYNTKTGLMADKKPTELKEGIDWDFKKVGIVDKNTFNVRVRDADKDRFLEKATEEEKQNYMKGKRKKVSYWKSVSYWFDLDAVRVPHKNPNMIRKVNPNQEGTFGEKGLPKGMGSVLRDRTEIRNNPLGKNPGDLWTIPTQPFPEAHFATFPEKLIKPMILAGCPQWICKKCGKARVRISKPTEEYAKNLGSWTKDTDKSKELRNKIGFQAHTKKKGLIAQYQTIGWTDCGCNAGWKPGIVLDPFMGSGTTAVMARRLNRDFIGIELNSEYIKIAHKRLKLFNFI